MLRALSMASSDAFWAHSLSSRVFRGALEFLMGLCAWLHPRIIWRAEEDATGASPPEKLTIDLYGPSRPYVVTVSPFDIPFRLDCRSGQLQHARTLRGRVREQLDSLREKLQKLVAGEAFVEAMASASTPGLPTVRQALSALADWAEESYEPRALQGVRNCGAAAEALRAGVQRMRVRMPVAIMALHVALLHSAVPPNTPPTNVRHAHFHDNLAGTRSEVLRQLLLTLNLVEDPGGSQGGGWPRRRLEAAEIGTHAGLTSAKLLEHVPRLTLTSIDPYLDPNISPQQAGIVRRMLSRYGRRSELWKLTSLAASTMFNRTLDLVFIDGDHSYDAVISDLGSWVPKVRPGGVVVGHDFNARWPGVVRAVHEEVASRGAALHLGPDSTWWFWV